MNKFEISIIIPCYNASAFIEQLNYVVDNQIITRGG